MSSSRGRRGAAVAHQRTTVLLRPVDLLGELGRSELDQSASLNRVVLEIA
jgi:hypothetical protein